MTWESRRGPLSLKGSGPLRAPKRQRPSISAITVSSSSTSNAPHSHRSLDATVPLDAHDITDPNDAANSADAVDPNEPNDNAEAADPTEPIERAGPPIRSTGRCLARRCSRKRVLRGQRPEGFGHRPLLSTSSGRFLPDQSARVACLRSGDRVPPQ
jgi:hypothetical protein